jgi:hypothetical protein
MATELLLLSRSYCHLCHDMEEALAPLLGEFGASLQIVDIDQQTEWLEKYDELVPVLLLDGHELCHYFLDEPRIREVLGQIR